MSSSFDFERIRRETFVSYIDFHEEIGSTNSRALSLAEQTRVLPALVLAERQTAGRGRGDRRWWTAAGGLTVTLLLNSNDAAIPPDRLPWTSLATGLAVAEAVARLVPGGDVRLKWPNDVFLNGRKVCGILVETAPLLPGVVAIGIGLNVNNSVSRAPSELQHIATSMTDVAGQHFDRSQVLIAVLQSLAECLTWIVHDISKLVESWRARCYLDGRTIWVLTGQRGSKSEVITGVCQSIDDQGALLLRTEAGVVRCWSGEVAKIL